MAFTITKAKSDCERSSVQKFAKRFWGEEEQLAFDRRFVITELPAYVAIVDKSMIGFISFAETNDAMIIVALGILPKYQNAGVGKRLVARIQKEAGKLKKKRLLVATSNDDLPALTFYQSIGFQIYEVKPDVIAEKHGATLKGIDGLPIRDELRLRKVLFSKI